MAKDAKQAISAALKSMEKARKDMMEVVVFSPTKAVEKDVSKIMNEVQSIEMKFKKLAKSISL
ncbi:hypothetical protein [Tateyamaria sp.]|uniref:hypothetical protein n=1 Tax=Tateyamaria sp. TaxID=1929288 RepID=UPI00329BC91F